MPGHVGRYALGPLIGRGGMGEVYQAFDDSLRRRVAIKRIRGSAVGAAGSDAADGLLSAEAQRRARLLREARLVAQLGHPAIVQVFDIVEEADGDWVVMEFVEGRTLAAILDEEELPLREILQIGRAIAEALEAAHRQGIVHRDLKLENVMRTDAGQIKVLDFGLAKRIAVGLPEEGESLAPSVEGQVVGTVRAMSPEQARGLPVDARSDLFSLGVLLYELAAERTPFGAATPLDTLMKVVSHRHASLSEVAQVPPALSALVDELLEKAPERRPQSAAEVKARLAALGREAGDSEEGAESSKGRARAVAKELAETASLTPGPAGAGELTAETVDAAAAQGPEVAAAVDDQASAPRSPAAKRRSRLLIAAALSFALGAGVGVARWDSRSRASSPSPPPESSLSPSPAAALPPPRDPRAEYQRGMALLTAFHRPGAVDEALAIFQRLLAADERSAPAYAGLGRAYWHRYVYTDESRDPMFLQQARAAAARAVALDELLADGRVSRGLVALESGAPDDAERDFEMALRLEAGNADAYDGLARVYLRREELDRAEAAYAKAIELAPADRHLYDDLGGLLVQRGSYERAIALFEKSIALAPDSAYGPSNLGAVYLLLGRYDEAAAQLQDALKIRPTASLYSNLGTVLFAQGLYAPAAHAFERALQMGGASNHHLFWANLADAYRQLPDAADQAREAYGQALAMLDAELARAPGDLTLRSRGALLRAKRGDCASPGGAALRAELATLDAQSAKASATAYTRYRIAVALELCGARPRALVVLARAVAAGFSAAEIANDPDLRALRADPSYHRSVRAAPGP